MDKKMCLKGPQLSQKNSEWKRGRGAMYDKNEDKQYSASRA